MFNSIDKKNSGRKYRTVALTGSDSEAARRRAVEMLAADSGEILDYIFTVDIFNEGVDIPEINQVIMLRPTESAIIFVQQLGRGLRKAKGKEYVVVLDFIANYDNNYLIPIALSGDRTGNKDNIRRYLIEGNNVIKGASTIYFDAVTRKRIFESIDAARINTKKIIIDSYRQFKVKLGRRPTLTDFDKYGEMDPLRIISYMDGAFRNQKMASYHGFLVAFDDLSETLSQEENHILEFVTQKYAAGKRLNEVLMLEVLSVASPDADVVAMWERSMLDNGLHCGEHAVRNVIGQMMEEQDGAYRVSAMMRSALAKPDFRSALAEVLDFARGRYEACYKSDSEFVVGKKYTYEDVFRLLNWKKNEVALNVGGYKFDAETKTYPVFVNYDKSLEINETIRYEDRFVDPSTLVAISKSKRTLASSDVRMAADSERNGVKMYLFVRKNKDDKESKEFYYLGRIHHEPDGLLEEFVMPNTDVSAVEIEYKLKTPVEKNLYDYLTSENV